MMGPAIIAPANESNPPRITTEKSLETGGHQGIISIFPGIEEIKMPPTAASTHVNIHDIENYFGNRYSAGLNKLSGRRRWRA